MPTLGQALNHQRRAPDEARTETLNGIEIFEVLEALDRHSRWGLEIWTGTNLVDGFMRGTLLDTSHAANGSVGRDAGLRAPGHA